MKYIDAEKLEAEIKRLKELLDSPICGCLTTDYKAGGNKQLDLLLSFVDSLQQEQQAVEGVVHHVMNAHYIVTNQEQLNARLREIPEGTKVNILICEAEEESK